MRVDWTLEKIPDLRYRENRTLRENIPDNNLLGNEETCKKIWFWIAWDQRKLEVFSLTRFNVQNFFVSFLVPISIIFPTHVRVFFIISKWEFFVSSLTATSSGFSQSLTRFYIGLFLACYSSGSSDLTKVEIKKSRLISKFHNQKVQKKMVKKSKWKIHSKIHIQ